MRTGRPPLTVGTWGEISTRRMPNGTWRARGRYRDYDGSVVQIARFRPTKTEAMSALKLAFTERQDPTASSITGHMRVKALIEVYLEDVAARASLAPTSRERYVRLAVDLTKPGMGDLQVREITVPAINRFLAAIARKHGYGTAKMTRSVLSGMVQLAIDHGALRDNPVRQARRLEAPRRQSPRALSVAEHAMLLDKVAADRKAREMDLVDLIEFLSATGTRIGEASAVRPRFLDLDAGVVEITATVTDGGIQEWTKTDAGWRVLAPPPHVVATLRRRIANPAINTDEVLFPSPLGRVRNRSNTTGELRRLFDRIGFDWVTSHTFRKTVATRLDEAGISAPDRRSARPPQPVNDHRRVHGPQDDRRCGCQDPGPADLRGRGLSAASGAGHAAGGARSGRPDFSGTFRTLPRRRNSP